MLRPNGSPLSVQSYAALLSSTQLSCATLLQRTDCYIQLHITNESMEGSSARMAPSLLSRLSVPPPSKNASASHKRSRFRMNRKFSRTRRNRSSTG
ncbi:hypothetical protein BDM02DRAFT_3215409 [Thelephora ganbajun]|uniref:Uncharacterized protein n=1 Tax=Thelephora ganbajun TaxID=370292 RepID=A0ACB6Z438_THEGA|nr:hypothetical protein BDM02DRAFT_3215409 [Thelephora ganbajun]